MLWTICPLIGSSQTVDKQQICKLEVHKYDSARGYTNPNDLEVTCTTNPILPDITICYITEISKIEDHDDHTFSITGLDHPATWIILFNKNDNYFLLHGFGNKNDFNELVSTLNLNIDTDVQALVQAKLYFKLSFEEDAPIVIFTQKQLKKLIKDLDIEIGPNIKPYISKNKGISHSKVFSPIITREGEEFNVKFIGLYRNVRQYHLGLFEIKVSTSGKVQVITPQVHDGFIDIGE